MLGEVLQIQHLKNCLSRLFICLSGTVYFTYFYLSRAFISLPVKMILHTSTKEIDQHEYQDTLEYLMSSANPARFSLY